MPYLSRLVVDSRSPRVLADLVSVYEMHRTLRRAFPAADADNRVLFRVDTDPRTGRPALLVQSREPADWSFLAEMPDYLYLPGDLDLANPAQKPLVLDLRAGELLAFRLRANPTFRRGRRRLAWLRRADQLAWLQRCGARGGFAPVALTVTQEGAVWTRKRVGGVSQGLCFRSVLFAGWLRVTDPQTLAETVADGLGSGKAFGFGLLSLGPAR